MAEAALMHCHACGHAPPADSLFCNQCGTRLVHDASNPAEKKHSYTPKHLVDKVLTMRSALEGERKQVTVLFVDIKGSVALSEQVNPEVWHQIMDRFFGLLSDGIHAHEGTINQYTGDGVMALFGAPIAHEDHARRACLAALQIQARLNQWGQSLMQEYGIDFSVRMGLNSGEVVVGRIGDDLRMDYTARGHTVGLAARMESMAKPGRIYISQFTAALVKREFELRERGEVRIKGVSHRVKVFELRRAAQRNSSRFQAAGDRISPMVGRWEETTALEAALEQSQAGHGQVVCFSGAPGLGKSRLCHEFAELCRERQLPVYETRGVSHFKAVPLAPFEEFVRSYFGLMEDDDADSSRERIAARLKSLDESLLDSIDVLTNLVSHAADLSSGSEDQARLAQLIQLGQRMIQAGMLDEPAVLIIENMQWIDDEPGTHIFFQTLVDAIADKHVLVVMTMRPEYVPGWLDRGHLRSITLTGLADRPALAMLDQLMGKHESLEPLKRLIIRRSGGNPLFMEELLGSLLDEGKLVKGRDGMRLKAPVDSIGLPAEVQVVVAARLDRLNEVDKRLLQIASVIGKRFTRSLLLAISGLSEAEFDHGIQRLLTTGWIYESRPDDNVEYAFHQSLVRDVAYHSQLVENRSHIHRAVAEFLSQEVCAGEDMAVVAHHFSEAGELLLAANWEVQAAEWYGQRNIETAMRHWRQLLQLLPSMDDSPDRCRISLQAHARIIHLGAYYDLLDEQADALIERASRIAERCDDPVLRAYFLLACGASRQTRGDLKGGLEYLEQAEAVAQALEAGPRAAIRVGWVHGLLVCGQISQAHAAAEEALTWLHRDVDAGRSLLGRSPYLSLLTYKAQTLAFLGQFKEAATLAEKVLQQARKHLETQAQVQARIVLSLVSGECGHPRKALNHAREAHALCEKSANRVMLYSSILALARASLVAGNPGRALRLLKDAVERLRAGTVAHHEEPRFMTLLAKAHLASGDHNEARSNASEAIKLARRMAAPHQEADAQLVLAETSLAAGRTGAEARDALERADELIQQTQALYLIPRWHLAQADAAARRSDTQLMQQALESAAEWLEGAGAKLRVKKLRARHKPDKSVKLDKS